MLMYIDDGCGAAKTRQQACKEANMVKRDIEQSGFVASPPPKCVWEPTQMGELLGYIFKLKEGIF